MSGAKIQRTTRRIIFNLTEQQPAKPFKSPQKSDRYALVRDQIDPSQALIFFRAIEPLVRALQK